jgi:glucan 1,3-beta-glucosidase
MDDVDQALGHIQNVKGSTDGVEFWVGETGWPTQGSKYQAATPSVSNALTFYKQGVCGALAWGVNVFYFEAFDEPWKPLSKGQDGSVADETHWGAYDATRKSKFDLTC